MWSSFHSCDSQCTLVLTCTLAQCRASADKQRKSGRGIIFVYSWKQQSPQTFSVCEFSVIVHFSVHILCCVVVMIYDCFLKHIYTSLFVFRENTIFPYNKARLISLQAYIVDIQYVSNFTAPLSLWSSRRRNDYTTATTEVVEYDENRILQNTVCVCRQYEMLLTGWIRYFQYSLSDISLFSIPPINVFFRFTKRMQNT